MDYPTAMLTALPIVTAIIMAGLAVMKYIGRKRNSNNPNSKELVTRKEMFQTFKDKLENVVYGDTFGQAIKGLEKIQIAHKNDLEKQITMTKEHLDDKIGGMQTVIIAGIKEELKNSQEKEKEPNDKKP